MAVDGSRGLLWWRGYGTAGGNCGGIGGGVGDGSGGGSGVGGDSRCGDVRDIHL